MPDLANRIRNESAAIVLNRLTHFFQSLIESLAIEHPNSRQAAVTFYVLARGNLRPLLGASTNLAEEVRAMQVDVAIFLRGVGLSLARS